MENIFKSFLACVAETRKLIKPFLISFLNIENKRDKDFDDLNEIFNNWNISDSYIATMDPEDIPYYIYIVWLSYQIWNLILRK